MFTRRYHHSQKSTVLPISQIQINHSFLTYALVTSLPLITLVAQHTHTQTDTYSLPFLSLCLRTPHTCDYCLMQKLIYQYNQHSFFHCVCSSRRKSLHLLFFAWIPLQGQGKEIC